MEADSLTEETGIRGFSFLWILCGLVAGFVLGAAIPMAYAELLGLIAGTTYICPGPPGDNALLYLGVVVFSLICPFVISCWLGYLFASEERRERGWAVIKKTLIVIVLGVVLSLVLKFSFESRSIFTDDFLPCPNKLPIA